MNSQINQYIDSKKLAWAPSTLRSEARRLSAVAPLVTEQGHNPEAIYNLLVAKGMAAYSIKTLFIRLSDFYAWLAPSDANPYRGFMEENRRLFKHVYQKERINVTFEQAFSLCSSIKEKKIRIKALQLLTTGMRYNESCRLNLETGITIGKGNKPRRIYLAEQLKQEVTGLSYSTFARRLKEETGLKPHTLRKLAATEILNRGASLQDLMELMGWSNISTASSYLQPSQEDKLAKFMGGLSNG